MVEIDIIDGFGSEYGYLTSAQTLKCGDASFGEGKRSNIAPAREPHLMPTRQWGVNRMSVE